MALSHVRLLPESGQGVVVALSFCIGRWADGYGFEGAGGCRLTSESKSVEAGTDIVPNLWVNRTKGCSCMPSLGGVAVVVGAAEATLRV